MIVDDHEISRAACRALLRAEGIDVVADLTAGRHALTTARELRPEVVIVDITPSANTGFAIARQLRELPDPPTVLITSSADRSQFGRNLEQFRFIAKADISAAAITGLVTAARADRPQSQNP